MNDLEPRIEALELEIQQLQAALAEQSQINQDQQESIAKYLNRVAEKQRQSDLPIVFVVGTLAAFILAIVSLEITSAGVSFTPRQTITSLVAVPGLVGAAATLLLPLIKLILKRYNIESGDIVDLPALNAPNTPKSS